MTRVLLACLFASGLSGLVYELLWTRWFGLAFGTMAVSVSVVLAAFFFGLAAGSHLMGRFARRVRRPLRWYAALELVIAGFGALSPTLIGGLHDVEVALGGATGVLLTTLRFALALLVLVVPTAAMGATLPVLLQGLGHGHERPGQLTAHVYGVNTLGAVAGAYATTFWLLPYAGGHGTLVFAVALNVAVALAALLVDRRATPLEPVAAASPRGPAVSVRLPLALAFGSGLVSIGLEVVLSRVLSVILEGTLYALGAVLAVFLLGIALGSLLVGPLLDRARAHPDRGWAAYGAVCVGVLATVALAVALLPAGHFGAGALERAVTDPVLRMHTKLLVSVAVLLPTALGFGAAFPLLVVLFQQHAGALGEGLGRLYAVNTFGAIAGSTLAGLVLVPWLGSSATLLVLLVLLALQAALAAAAGGSRLVLYAAVAVLGLFGVAWPGLELPALMRSHGAADLCEAVRARELAGADTAFFAEGASGAVAVYGSQDTRWHMVIDGLPQAGRSATPPEYPPESVVLAAFPYAVHPAPKRALVIGYGGGVTTDVLARGASIERVRVIEIEPRVVEAVEAMYPVGTAPHRAPKVELVLGDARNELLRSDERYDLVVSQPSHPWLAGAGGLATREFFRLVRQRLNPGGLVMVWLGTWGEQHARSVAAALSAELPELALVTYKSSYLLASAAPLELDVERVSARVREPGLAPLLAPLELDSAEALLAGIVGIGGATPTAVPANTDDNAFVEVHLPLTMNGHHLHPAQLLPPLLAQAALGPQRFTGDPNAVLLELAERALGTPGGRLPAGDDLSLLASLELPEVATARVAAWPANDDVATYLRGRLLLAERKATEAARALAEVPEGSGVYSRARRFLAVAHKVSGDPASAEAVLEPLVAAGDADAAHLYGGLRAPGDPRGLAALEAARAERPEAAVPLARAAWSRGERGAGLQMYRRDLERVVARDPAALEAHEALLLLAFDAADDTAARRHQALAVEAARARAATLVDRAERDLEASRYGAAAEALRRALALDPTPEAAWIALFEARLRGGDEPGAEAVVRQARGSVRDVTALEVGLKQVRARLAH